MASPSTTSDKTRTDEEFNGCSEDLQPQVIFNEDSEVATAVDAVSYLLNHQHDVVSKRPHFQFTTINDCADVDTFDNVLTDSDSSQPQVALVGNCDVVADGYVVSCSTHSPNRLHSKHQHLQLTASNNAVASSSRIPNEDIAVPDASLFTNPFFASDEFNSWYMDTLTKGVRFVLDFSFDLTLINNIISGSRFNFIQSTFCLESCPSRLGLHQHDPSRHRHLSPHQQVSRRWTR